MRKTIESALRARRREHGALPSVRELAAEFGAASRTVQLALRTLREEGLVNVLDRKGYFWGSAGTDASGAAPESPDDRFRVRFLSDLRQGAYHPWKELPSRRSLAQLHGVGSRCAGRVLGELVERGILERRGRSLFPATGRSSARSSAVVLVVVRCDAEGTLQLDSERETDFLKSLRRELDERGLEMLRVGFHEGGGGRFLDGSGREIDPARTGMRVLGAVVSTWLVADPAGLLERLARLRIPLSVWWEHEVDRFPSRRFPAGIAGFDISFGESAGAAVGRHLVGRGVLDVAYLSPYHTNEWSVARLRGLRDTVELHGGRVSAWVEARFSSPWEIGQVAGSPEGARELLDRIVEGFLDDPGLREIPTWVVVNDLAAVATTRAARRKGIAIPRLVSFDNTSESERRGFDSFEFHTDGMVRQMLHHILNPHAEIFSRTTRIQEMVGRLVVRGGPR